ncbi:MAG TPA: mucoidy inhibitor MuiA family protein, partial [Planctomycetota bacterium]|nr:mucoidy inhibitor MuiA family protein [Planctomycetota bacterium]
MHLLAFAFVALQSDARPLPSKIRDVTVFADRALVRRAAEVPAGGGKFVVTGLPLAADPEQVRVRCSGGDVTDVDVTEMRMPAMPDARREELRRQWVELGREDAALADEQVTLQAGIASAIEVLNVASKLAKAELLSGKLDVAAWSAQQDTLLARVRLQKEALRTLEERRAEAARRKQELQQALGSADVAGGVVSRQVALEVIAASATVLEVEYVVFNAGWRPTYDLRAAADARTVQLVYRADVFQQSGEDWDAVDVSLSTAAPHLGAQGPEPRPAWVSFFEEAETADRLRSLGYDGNGMDRMS